MRYGARYLQWAPFASANPEPEDALPNYGTPVNLGALNKVTDSPTYNEAKGYGDDALKVYVNEFKEAAVDIEVTELANAVASAVLGASLSGDEAPDLEFGADDNAPYGGLGFFISKMLDGNKKAYQGIFYPKLKASMQGEEYSTKGETITLANSKLKLLAAACNNGKWKIKSDDFDTAAKAKAWVDAKVAAAAGG